MWQENKVSKEWANFNRNHDKSISKAKTRRSLGTLFFPMYKPVGLYTGECIHGQKKVIGVAMGLYTGGTIDG